MQVEILESMTNVDPNELLPSRIICLLYVRLKGRDDENGNRSLKLRLPPDWSKQGVYSLMVVGKTLWLRRGSEEVPLTEFSRKTGLLLSSLYIEFGFSDQRAQLKRRLATTFVTQVSSLWAEATAQRMASPHMCV